MRRRHADMDAEALGRRTGGNHLFASPDLADQRQRRVRIRGERDPGASAIARPTAA